MFQMRTSCFALAIAATSIAVSSGTATGQCDWAPIDGSCLNGFWTYGRVAVGTAGSSQSMMHIDGKLEDTDGIHVSAPGVGMTGVLSIAHGMDGIGVVGRGGGGWFGGEETWDGIGVQGTAHSMNGVGVEGIVYPAGFSNTSPGSGTGVRGTTFRTNGKGVHGISESTSGFGIGVFGESKSPNGYGVYGSSENIGVLGLCDAANGIGVWGSAGGANSLAGKFSGRGTFSSHLGIGREDAFNGNTMLSVKSGANGYGGMYMETSGSSGRPFYGYSANGGVDAFHYYDGPSGQWRLFLSGTRLNVNKTDGRVGIGTTSPAALLHVNGSAAKPGGGSWTATSDIRLKTDIEPMVDALDTLLSLEGVTFRYKDPEAINELPGTRLGMIAQQVETVMPDWVEDGTDGFKRLTIRGFEALTVEAIREIVATNDALRDQNLALQHAVNDQQKQIAELRAMIESLAARTP